MKLSVPNIHEVSAPKTFEITSGTLRVTDPCYEVGTWCAGTLDKVKTGQWQAQVGYFQDPHEIAYLTRRKSEDRARTLASYQEGAKTLVSTGQHTKAEVDSMIATVMAMFDAEQEPYLGRVAFIHIGCGDLTEIGSAVNDWKRANIDVGVDSGQVGFFDERLYPLNPVAIGSTLESFYEPICELTGSDEQFGVLAFGVVSSSGYGDGSYDCFTVRNAEGLLVEAVIIFISGDEDEENNDA